MQSVTVWSADQGYVEGIEVWTVARNSTLAVLARYVGHVSLYSVPWKHWSTLNVIHVCSICSLFSSNAGCVSLFCLCQCCLQCLLSYLHQSGLLVLNLLTLSRTENKYFRPAHIQIQMTVMAATRWACWENRHGDPGIFKSGNIWSKDRCYLWPIKSKLIENK